MKLRGSIIAVFFILFCNLNAQDFRFHHLTSEDGISQSEVYAFLEDSRGFMWIGTLDGLNRYDGYSIETYNVQYNASHSLSNNTIRCLAEDHLGRIWIGTNDGLNFYDPISETFQQVDLSDAENKYAIWSMCIANDLLLVGTDEGLWRTSIGGTDIHEIEDSFYRIKSFSHTPDTTAFVRSVKKSNHGGFWILTGQKVCQVVFTENALEPIVIDDLDYSFQSPLVNMAEDLTGNLWITSGTKGLAKYNPITEQTIIFSQGGNPGATISNKCSSITIDKRGNIWIGTLDMGVYFIRAEDVDKEQINFNAVHHQHGKADGLNSNLIYSLYVSSDNILWVGTIGSGVNIYDPEQKNFMNYRFYNRTPEVNLTNFIRSVYVDQQNMLWIGTHNNGLFIMDRQNGNFRKIGFGTLSVFHISKYEDNKILICAGEGLHLVELKGNDLFIHDKISDEYNSAFFYATRSDSGVFWAGSLNGLFRFTIENNQFKNIKRYNKESAISISENNCRVILYDQERNQLLVGTEGGGLNIISLDREHFPNSLQIYENNGRTNSLSNNYIRSIIKDQQNNFWIGTFLGLNKMTFGPEDGKPNFTVYLKSDGLPNNLIQSIVEDKNNNLWIGTNGGLSNFKPGTEQFVNFTTIDGLQGNEFSEHAAFQTPSGEIIMGGLNGINAFRPEQIYLNRRQPRTTVTEFILYNKPVRAAEKVDKRIPLPKSILVSDTIILGPKQKNIGFKFSAMIYPKAGKVKYEYILEGFDEVWHSAEAMNRYAYYTNLRHGKYTFKVRSTNADGIWQDAPKEVFVHIQTPFKFTILAYLIYAVILLLILFYFTHFTVIRYTTKNKLLLEKVHNEELNKLNELRTRFFINISHDLRTPLSLIKGPLESILQKSITDNGIKENLLTIKRNVKRLSYLVEQLLDVRKAESGSLAPNLQREDIVQFTKQEVAHFTYSIKNKGLKLVLNFESDTMYLSYDPGMISKVYFNIISNAIKFTECGEIVIGIERVSRAAPKFQAKNDFASYMKVEVRDTGCGMSNEEQSRVFERFYQDEKKSTNGYGIGLSHAKELIEVHQGFIEVQSQEDLGTAVSFYLPERELPLELKEKRAISSEDIYIESDVSIEENEVSEVTSGKTVLVVEDNKDMCNYIARELKTTYRVRKAYDGISGVKIANESIPDIIISDVMMPNMDGFELCEKIKSNLKTSHIPVILLTAKVDDETKYKGIETGADDYIPKPFEMEYLKIRIKNILKSRDQLRKLFQNSINLEPSAVTVTSLDEKFLSSLLQEIEAGMSDSNFTISSLESKMRMSHANFYRKIKQLTGQSGQELVHSMRMKRARQILTDNRDIRVSEVAFMVGFNNPNYFSTCFKKVYGFAPSDLKT